MPETKITTHQRDLLLSSLPPDFTMETINLIRRYWGRAELVIGEKKEDPLSKAEEMRINIKNAQTPFPGLVGHIEQMAYYYKDAIIERDKQIEELTRFKQDFINDQIMART